MSLTSLRFRPLLLAALLASSFATHAATPTGLDALGQTARLTLPAAAGVSWTRLEAGVQLQLGNLTRNVLFYGPQTVRVSTHLGQSHASAPSLVVVQKPVAESFTTTETDTTLTLQSSQLRVLIDKRTAAITFQRLDGSPLTRESAPAELQPSSFDGSPTYQVTQGFQLQDGESLYGLGQYNEPYWDYRGRDVLMVQTNIGIVLPFMLSSQRYGLLWDVYSKMRFTDDAQGARFWADSAPAGADYYLVAGQDMDAVMRGLRTLTGAATMLPKTAFGLFMSKERYQTQAQVLDVVKRFRADHFPLDNIVQDWQYWGGAADGTWSGMIWDHSRYPDPRAMIDTLHRDLHTQFMISIWPSVGNKTELARELDANGLRFGPMEGVASQAQIYDAFSEKGREIYFRHLKKGLLDVGVDALWMDGTEVEVSGAAHDPGTVERDIKAMRRNAMGDFSRYLNVYSLLTTGGVYHGQRAIPGPRGDKRVMTLTRSAWAGQQRYGAFAWSGDTRASWATFRAQISGGLNVGMGGQPYWTQDTGGFFVSHQGGERNPAYRELFARWHQFGIFNPVYRIHGTDVVREPYHFKDSDPAFYNSLRSAAELRYRLLPYHYGLAWRTHADGYIPMRGLVMDFPDEAALRGIDEAFMYGPAFLVRPVTRSVKYAELPRARTIPATALRTPDGQPGLAVTYYQGTNFEKQAGQAVSTTVDHNWPEPPLSSFPPGLTSINNFSARWVGQLIAPESGEYEIGLEGDDGFRLWLDDKLLIEDWKNGATRRESVKVSLQKDQVARVRIEFYQGGGERNLRLSWRTPAQLKALAEEQANVDPRIATRLPSGSDWFDFWTGARHSGGSTVQEEYPLDRFPLFVRAGSIVPMGPVLQYVNEQPKAPIEIRVYPGRDASFTLYEDDGDSYAYERGQRATVQLRWDDAKRQLQVAAREGSFPGLVQQRQLQVRLMPATAKSKPAPARTVTYRGQALTLQFP